MSEIKAMEELREKMVGTSTEKAVGVMRLYGEYIRDNAEILVGDVDSPNYIADGGLTVTFTLDSQNVPTVTVTHERLALSVMEMDAERNRRTTVPTAERRW